MDGLEQLPAQYQQLAGIVFAAVVAIGAAVTFLRGKKEGQPAPKVQEFYAAGQLADMGPVKELVEQTGLLVQQQVRTAITLEANAVALTAIERQIKDYVEERRQERADRDLDAEVQRRVDERVRAAMEDIEPKPRRPRGGL